MPAPRDPDRLAISPCPDLAATTGSDSAQPAERPAPSVGFRYTLGEEVGQGGMGVVYRAVDSTFGRDVAVKVLHEKYAPDSGAAKRFADEARITGQLQHPAIPPAHDLGTLPDGRPFLAMKLIRGQTLERKLAARSELSAERGRYVAVFEQVCQALAYAHAHNVIHRDLKPANVMVGNYGEVQVMDWGLAKVLPPGGHAYAGADPNETTGGTQIQSLRDIDGSFTQAGSMLGTPAFMPPEQAVGALGKIDARSDVFGLGGILAVILTGKPPFAASSAETTRVLAAQGDVTECFDRLDACGAEPELIALCKRCLSPKPADRPGDANEVAKTVADLRARSEDRARQAELERAKAEVQAQEQRKRRKTVVVAATALAIVLTLGIIGTGLGLFRADTMRKNAEKAQEAEAELRQTAEKQRDEIATQEKLGKRRLAAYSRAVDTFANEAPGILDGHPLGSAPMEELIQLSLRLDREAREEAGEQGLTAHGELCSLIQLGHYAKSRGRNEEALKHYDECYRLALELLRTSAPNKKGTNLGNLAVTIGNQARMQQARGESQCGFAQYEKARESFAEAVRLHGEAIALHRRVLVEPEMRDVGVGEAHASLASASVTLAEMHRVSLAACESPDEKRTAHLAARDAARQAEEHYSTGLAKGGIKAHRLPRIRLRQAHASHERARAANALADLAGDGAGKEDREEAAAAYQRSFDLFDELVKDTPKYLLHRIEFATLAAERGEFLMKFGDPKRAHTALSAAVAQTRRVAQPLELSHYLGSLARNQYLLAEAALKIGNKDEAKNLFTESLHLYESQLREAIRVSSPTASYTFLPRIRLMYAQARVGDHVSAASSAATVRAECPKDTDKLGYAASVFALCAEATDDPKLKEKYLAQAFETLTLAVDQGYSGLSERSVEPLRSDARFPPLLERSRANARAAAMKKKVRLTFPPAPERDSNDKLIGRWVPKQEKFVTQDIVYDYTKDGKYTMMFIAGDQLHTSGIEYKRNGDKLTRITKFGERVFERTVTVKRLTDTELETSDDTGKIESFTRAKASPKK